MARLTKSQLRSPRTKEVTIDDWGGEILIRSLSGRERQDLAVFASSEAAKLEPVKMQAMAVWYGCVEPSFENEEEVLDSPGTGIQQAFQAIMEHSGLGDPDEAKGN
jgi:hypothetical protein